MREGSEPGLATVLAPHPPWPSFSGGSRQPIWCRSCGEVGGGLGASPHRPAINHSYVARGQGVGGGRGAATAAHVGQGREARVRCSCKLSPKCLQAKANQGAVTGRTWPYPAPVVDRLLSGQVRTHSQIRKHTWTRSTHRGVHAKVSHLYLESQRCTHTPNLLRPCVYVHTRTHTHTHTQPSSSAPTHSHSGSGTQRSS